MIEVTSFDFIIDTLIKYSNDDLESSIKAGKFLVESVWGDVGSWRSSNHNKNATLKALFLDPRFPFGKATAIRKMNLYEMDDKYGGLGKRWPKLYLSHFEQAIYWDDRERWLDLATENGWSVVKMREERAVSRKETTTQEIEYKRALSLIDRTGDLILKNVHDPVFRESLKSIAKELQEVVDFANDFAGSEKKGDDKFPFVNAPDGV